jgi:hypothetical protein
MGLRGEGRRRQDRLMGAYARTTALKACYRSSIAREWSWKVAW